MPGFNPIVGRTESGAREKHAHLQSLIHPDVGIEVLSYSLGKFDPRGHGVDGFLIQPSTLPGGLNDFVDLVIPELQARELFRTEYEGSTLRDNLGLPRPVSRYERKG